MTVIVAITTASDLSVAWRLTTPGTVLSATADNHFKSSARLSRQSGLRSNIQAATPASTISSSAARGLRDENLTGPASSAKPPVKATAYAQMGASTKIATHTRRSA